MIKIASGRKRKLVRLSVVLLFLLAAALDVSSLSSFPQENQDQKIYHNVAVSAISIAVTVQDRRGRFINDLSREDFQIYENNEEKEITYFNHNFDAPLSLTILLDVSGSMALQDKLLESKEALKYLLTFLIKRQDEVSLLIFADGEVEVAVKFSKNKSDILAVLKNTDAYGQTALNDAVAVSPEFANRGGNEKRALLLITDGIENDSQYSPEQAIEIARRVDIPIYTIGYKIPLSEQYLKKYKRSPDLTASGIIESLERFSLATGGKAFFINQAEEMSDALRKITREIGHQYIIGYTSYRSPESEYRKIKVTTSKKRYRVRTREGYYSGEKEDSQ